MIPLISRLLTFGYTAGQILNYVSKKFKGMSQSVKSAQSHGYSDEDILKHISRGIQAPISKDDLTAEQRSLKGSGYLTKEEREERKQKYLKNALQLGSTALAAYGTYSAMRGMREPEAIEPTEILPKEEKPLLIGTDQQIPSPPEPMGPTSPMQGITPGMQVAQNVVTPSPPVQPISPPSPEIPQKGVTDLSVGSKLVDRILKGKQLKDFPSQNQKEAQFLTSSLARLESQGFDETHPQVQKLTERLINLGKPKGLLEEERQRFQETYPIRPDEKTKIEEFSAKDPIISPQITPKNPPSKGDIVVDKKGKPLKVKSYSGANALVEEEGKLKKIPIEDLRAEPQAIKKSKVIFDPSIIPESERSAALSFVIPMPGKKMITVIHHGEPTPYVYMRKDGREIDESVIRALIDGTEVPITSGETYMGGWDSNVGDSRGSKNFKELIGKSHSIDAPDDPEKEYTFQKLEDVFVHGYIKNFYKLLKEFTRAHGAKKK